MIRPISDPQVFRDFLPAFRGDPLFSEPMLFTPEQLRCNLLEPLSSPWHRVLGVWKGKELTGLFSFLILQEERYLEMLVGLSRDADAYGEIADWLQEACSGFHADFVFNPRNPLLRALLEQKGASFDPEQQRMAFSGPPPELDTAGVEPLSAQNRAQYEAIHNRDVYWTGDKVAEATDRFRALVAMEGEAAVGYLDVTYGDEENEIYDLLVLESRRRRGWGRKLLAKAMAPGDRLMLMVDVDNAPAIALYRSLGFETVPGQNSLTATWQIP